MRGLPIVALGAGHHRARADMHEAILTTLTSNILNLCVHAQHEPEDIFSGFISADHQTF